MSKTVPQLKKIDRRADPEQVETISSPYEWQRKLQQSQSQPKKRGDDLGDIQIKTVPQSQGPRRR